MKKMYDVVLEYDKADKIPKIDSKTIKFVSYAEDGACGNSGEMYIITKTENDVHRYCFSCWHETPIENFDLLLPWLVPFLNEFNNAFPDPKMFDIELEGWKHCYLGLGNHLFVNDDVYPLFADDNIFHLISTHQHSKLLMCWKNRAERILGVTESD